MAKTLDRAHKMYIARHGPKPFEFDEEYKLLKDNPKWKLENKGNNNQADVRGGRILQLPIRARLERVADEAPTSANTKKPQGVKKARKNKKILKELDLKEKDEIRLMNVDLESITNTAKAI